MPPPPHSSAGGANERRSGLTAGYSQTRKSKRTLQFPCSCSVCHFHVFTSKCNNMDLTVDLQRKRADGEEEEDVGVKKSRRDATRYCTQLNALHCHTVLNES